MPASNTDKFKKAKRRFSTTVGVGGFAQGATTLPLASTAGLDTDTAITLVIDPGSANEEVITGVVSGSNIINCLRAREGTTDTAHSPAETVTMYFTETHWDDLVDGVLTSLDQDGTLKASAVDSSTVLANSVVTAAKLATDAVETAKIKDLNVTTGKIADDAVTSAKLYIDPTTDANGYKVYDFGVLQMYKKRITFSQSVGTGPTFGPSTSLPVGMSSISTNNIQYSYATNGNAGGLVMVLEATTGSTTLGFTCSSTDSARTYTGWIDIFIINS
jgi:hypothetical protein